MSELKSFVNERVLVITNDGRVLVGMLKGFDQVTNLILSDCQERIFSLDEGVETATLGLYLVRGDAVVVVGLVDKEQDENLQLAAIRAKPLPDKLAI
ncbi:U6 snRNA-associated Sm-like protein [Dispira parvispora]|uniref:LSM2-LSM8 complex subunit LSM8 n=1 Tax=Dispira parvispora TaxID=1520584 RepID=A0A9W8ALT3_9FUNG|nr:U6 snRNA-associated Sm-like protein [Dispira parvispora]